MTERQGEILDVLKIADNFKYVYYYFQLVKTDCSQNPPEYT